MHKLVIKPTENGGTDISLDGFSLAGVTDYTLSSSAKDNISELTLKIMIESVDYTNSTADNVNSNLHDCV
jgi:hypothetical protein